MPRVQVYLFALNPPAPKAVKETQFPSLNGLVHVVQVDPVRNWVPEKLAETCQVSAQLEKLPVFSTHANEYVELPNPACDSRVADEENAVQVPADPCILRAYVEPIDAAP